jgi:threonine dehydrogenase-like Zn-dependent dehydrogenase
MERTIYGLENVPDSQIKFPTDAIVRVVASCVCGSDLWPYRSVTSTQEPHRIGHEFVDILEDVGREVTKIKKGNFVIAPFAISDLSIDSPSGGPGPPVTL